ncbi:MAG: hypothetical protein HFE63_04185 [Clostridiales bacterium]|nr:hypothetical protein [Clostridiales bacterium]
MVHTFKFGGHRFAYDSASGSLHILDELGYKMLDYIELPMPKDCPSALRYDLAKYDSAAISDKYDEMYKLYTEGKLYSEDSAFDAVESECKDSGCAIAFSDGNLCGHSNPHIIEHAIAAGESALKIVSCADDPLCEDELPELLKELEKYARDLIKRGEKNMFAPVETCEHKFDVCKKCWARHICSVECPSVVRCELERKRAECELALGSKE